eukprot:scaffold3257_cov67-Phaeocystis_antarctica.AAC.2
MRCERCRSWVLRESEDRAELRSRAACTCGRSGEAPAGSPAGGECVRGGREALICVARRNR